MDEIRGSHDPHWPKVKFGRRARQFAAAVVALGVVAAGGVFLAGEWRVKHPAASVQVPTAGPSASLLVAAALRRRPLQLPLVRVGQPCPTSPGKPMSTADFGGIALGSGPVRLIIANAGDPRHGIALLGSTSEPGWLALSNLWFSAPSYQGPFLIRVRRLDAAGVVAVGDSPQDRSLLVPSGPTINTYGGYRTRHGATWAKGPGCYGWQVDGLTFSEVIVVRATAP